MIKPVANRRKKEKTLTNLTKEIHTVYIHIVYRNNNVVTESGMAESRSHDLQVASTTP